MLNRKLIMGAALALLVMSGFGTEIFGKKKAAKFTVRIENVSMAEGLAAQDGSKYPFALSPGLFSVSSTGAGLFKPGRKATAGLEAQAEDGNPAILKDESALKVGSVHLGVFNTPVGGSAAGPLLPGGAYEFTFEASEGMKLNLIAMYGQSNDLFYASEKAVDLFVKGQPLSGDITNRFRLWDAGTEVNQAPGIGDQQAPRQKAPNTGTAENGRVKMVSDGFTYPMTQDVLRITVTAE